jgi:ribonuclease E
VRRKAGPAEPARRLVLARQSKFEGVAPRHVEADASRAGAKRRRSCGVRDEPSEEVVDTEALGSAADGRGARQRPAESAAYLMCVQVRPTLTQVAVCSKGRTLNRALRQPSRRRRQPDPRQHLPRQVQNVLPGMEAAFVDIATPKNAVLYRGDVQYDAEDIVEKAAAAHRDSARAQAAHHLPGHEEPDRAKGARLTQEVSLPGRFVVLIPNSKTYGISKRLPDDVRKRLRGILDRVKPAEHGLIVRTAAEDATSTSCAPT